MELQRKNIKNLHLYVLPPDGRVRISSYDMNKGTRAFVEVSEIERHGKYIVNAQRLYQTVRVLPDENAVAAAAKARWKR